MRTLRISCLSHPAVVARAERRTRHVFAWLVWGWAQAVRLFGAAQDCMMTSLLSPHSSILRPAQQHWWGPSPLWWREPPHSSSGVRAAAFSLRDCTWRSECASVQYKHFSWFRVKHFRQKQEECLNIKDKARQASQGGRTPPCSTNSWTTRHDGPQKH
jgi:hypothetical protein